MGSFLIGYVVYCLTNHFCIPTCELSFQICILNSARNVLFSVVSDGKEPVFLALKVTIATLLGILCLGVHISAKLLPCPNSGILSRCSSKFWFDHLGWTLGRHGHFDAVPPSRSRDLRVAGQTRGAWESKLSWQVQKRFFF